ncbi:MAG: hypothetical protein N2746_03555 [Deltaproteobacteria bacterium]|nr:hypothetical protein [Deltaproteobacteria bacterium]
MKRRFLVISILILIISLLILYISSCGGTGSACEDLLHRACDCLYPDNPTQREECHTKIDEEVASSPFTAEEDSKCQTYIDTCDCTAMKNGDKNACGDVLDSL